MSRRKWLVRGLVGLVLGAAAAAAGGYLHLTRPEAVRRQIVDKVGAIFQGADVRVESARWRLFGG